MSAFRQPGPTCDGTAPWRLDDGTLGPLRSPIPGPVGMSIALEQDQADTPWWCPTRSLLPDVRYLFNSCRNPQRGLTEANHVQAAEALGVEVAAIVPMGRRP